MQSGTDTTRIGDAGSAREQALRGILQVISRNRSDEEPVFEAILQNAARLCAAPMAMLLVTDPAQKTLRLAAAVGQGLRSLRIGDTWALSEGPLTDSIRRARSIQTEDLARTAPYLEGDPGTVQLVDGEGLRTRLSVPLVRDGASIGTIILCRRDVAPFGSADIELVETFADQAVIAIENVRQFREVQTRLEREAAAREVLQVISASRTDPAPVFDAILKNASHLSRAPLANLCLLDESRAHWHLVAHFGGGLRHLAVGQTPRPLDSNLVPALAMRQARVVHIEDLSDTDLYRQGDPGRVAMVESEGMRTILCVPLLIEGKSVGCITLFRREVKAFLPEEIELVETFATHAVIAIENVRQFREVQTRLEREAATREILEVISRSRDDQGPVFDVILENATRLCNAPLAMLSLADDAREFVTMPAWRGALPEFAATLKDFRHPVADSPLFAVVPVREGKTLRIADIADDDLYRSGNPSRVLTVDVGGIRSIMSVPLLSDGVGIGAIILYRREVAPFSDEDEALIRGFAAQAVIAIDNVRQFKALAARTHEVQSLNASLETRVRAQVDELERLGRLKRFLSPQVADAVVSSGESRLLSSHRALIATLFCDMRGFTAFCETAEPEETIEVLQTYHEEMGKLINAHGAGVDQRAGDGIMVIFNDPLPCDDPAGDALRLALDMHARMAELCARWKRLGHRLGFGVGISLGYATVGMVGSEGRYDYTASGTAVNLAARLCDQAGNGETLLSPRAYMAVEDQFTADPVGALTLKGIHAPTEVFRVTGARGTA